ncbi:hypothetical protein Patl1_18405 [Pistacia atlantica]|uniref:Uncharacterized protein n=1 Tax=Pistacia atlantica TaxID=434234 RepID=A0ACC1C1M9_9ROSI|nr:hypothetical protein Patl1_18405 [Pistacia atlantica]
MCHQTSCGCLSAEEATTGEESLLIYCKPVELYNILRCRAQHNVIFCIFLQKLCLHFFEEVCNTKYGQSAKGVHIILFSSRAEIVVFNYRDYSNMLQKTEVTEDFSCPFCSMQCASFKGLRYHLCSSHDLFNFEFWVTEDYQAVNVSVKTDILRAEVVAGGVDPQLQPFFFCSKPRRCRPKKLTQNERRVNIQFLELDSPKLPTDPPRELSEKNDGEKVSKSSNENKLQDGRDGDKNSGFDVAECIECVGSSFNVPGVSIAMAQSSVDPECVKSLSGSEAAVPTMLHVVKSRKITTERSDPRNRVLLHKRQFYHSHRVQLAQFS